MVVLFHMLEIYSGEIIPNKWSITATWRKDLFFVVDGLCLYDGLAPDDTYRFLKASILSASHDHPVWPLGALVLQQCIWAVP